MNTPTGYKLSEHFARPSDRPGCETCGRPSTTFQDRQFASFAGQQHPYRVYYCARHANTPTDTRSRIVATGAVVVDRAPR